MNIYSLVAFLAGLAVAFLFGEERGRRARGRAKALPKGTRGPGRPRNAREKGSEAKKPLPEPGTHLPMD